MDYGRFSKSEALNHSIRIFRRWRTVGLDARTRDRNGNSLRLSLNLQEPDVSTGDPDCLFWRDHDSKWHGVTNAFGYHQGVIRQTLCSPVDRRQTG